MFLVAGCRKKFGFVENAQEFRHFTDEIEERAEPLNLLPRRMGGAGALDPVELHHFGGRVLGRLRHALISSSARNTRLSTLPDGLRGSWSRMTSCFGTLNAASRLRQCSVSSGNCSTVPSATTTTATGFSPQRSSGMPITATSRTCGIS